MPPYKFRVRFLLPSGCRINSPAERLDLSLPHGVGDVELIGLGPEKTITSSGELIVRSKGLPSLEQAQAAGVKVQVALLLVGAELGLGVDLGREAPRSHLTEYGRQWLAAQANYGGQLLNDHLGLVVYDDPLGTRFVKMEASFIVGKPIEQFKFTQTLATHVRNDPLDDKHILALELYNTAHFESSSRARFITLVSAVETLSSREIRPPDPLALVDGWREQLAAQLLSPEHKSPLQSALNELRSESIGSACRRLVGTLVGVDEANFFRDCYNARSDLLHEGTTTFPIREHLTRLVSLVGTLLVRYRQCAA